MTHDTFANRLNMRVWKVLRFPFVTRCPVCGEAVSQLRLLKTVKGRGRRHPLDHINCPGCASPLRIAGNRLPSWLVILQMTMFLFGAAVGSDVFARFEITGYFHEARGYQEPNLLGFLLMILMFVFPAVGFVGKLAKVELVEGVRDQ